MALQETLDELTERRVAYTARRAAIEEELRALRKEKLAAEQASIEGIIVKAIAEGATLGQVKRAYGTKDHRTIADIVTAREAEIQAVRDAEIAKRDNTDWFTIHGEQAFVTYKGNTCAFEWTEVDGKLMFITDEPLWDETATIKNEAVALLDGKTEDDSIEARTLAAAIRKQG